MPFALMSISRLEARSCCAGAGAPVRHNEDQLLVLGAFGRSLICASPSERPETALDQVEGRLFRDRRLSRAKGQRSKSLQTSEFWSAIEFAGVSNVICRIKSVRMTPPITAYSTGNQVMVHELRQLLQYAGWPNVSAICHSCASLLHCTTACETMSSDWHVEQIGVTRVAARTLRRGAASGTELNGLRSKASRIDPDSPRTNHALC